MDTITLIRIVTGLFALALLPLSLAAFWRIFSKAGFSGALSLLMLIPLVNVGVLCYVAFSKWNIRTES
jgi:uncharacterized membrane protein YhaH (DUF805 family)